MCPFSTAYVAEFIGTMVLIIFGNGVVSNCLLSKSKGFNGGWMVIATGWGLGVGMAVYLVGWESGAHINPAVTFGLAVGGSFPWAMVPGYIIAQVLGAFVGQWIVFVAYYRHYQETEDPGLILATCATSPAIESPIWNFLTEMIGTAVLLAGVCALGYKENNMSDMTPFMVGVLVWAIGLSLGGPTGYAINPARDLGPRIAHAFLPLKQRGSCEWKYAWVPIAGPLVGGPLGVILYNMAIRCWGAN